MKTNPKPNRNIFFGRLTAPAAVAVALLLTACGGGGDDNENNPSPNPGTTPSVPGPSTPVVMPGVPVAYAPGTLSATALDHVNRSITNCGYNPMTAVTDLTIAALAHVNYVALDSYRYGHDEIPGKPGFTGVSHYERIRAAGGSEERARSASEGVGGLGTIHGREGINLLSAPLHQADLLRQWSEIGVGTVPYPGNSGTGATLVLVYGGTELNNVQAHGVRTFPCAGTTDLGGQGGPETPDPFPGLNGDFGPGLNFETNKGGVIVVDSITLRNEATGQMVPVMEVKGHNLTAQVWRSMYVSRGHLSDNTSYRVEARGKTFATTNGNDSPVAWERNYSFKTF